MRCLVLAFLVAACGGSVISPSSSPDGGTPDTEAPDAPSASPSTAACNHCLASTIAWGMNGGLGDGSTDTSSLAPCRQYTHSRKTSAGTKECGFEIPACGRPDDQVDVLALTLARTDVQQALSGGTALFGSDPRPCDGAVLEITIGARTISVGGDCTAQCLAGSPCTPVPEGVRQLATILQGLDERAFATNACAL
jgi:hypothetical protein